MLDKNDVKEIGKLLMPIQKDISVLKENSSSLKTDVAGLKSDVRDLKKESKILKKDMAETRTDIKTLIAYFDRDYVGLRKRVEAIEEHLGLPSAH